MFFYVDVDSVGNAKVGFAKENKLLAKGGIAYMFFFDGIPDDVVELEKGQTVKIKGTVDDLRMANDVFIILVNSPQVIE